MLYGCYQAFFWSWQVRLLVFILLVFSPICWSSVSFECKHIIRLSCLLIELKKSKRSSSIEANRIGIFSSIIHGKCFKSLLIFLLATHWVNLLQFYFLTLIISLKRPWSHRWWLLGLRTYTTNFLRLWSGTWLRWLHSWLQNRLNWLYSWLLTRYLLISWFLVWRFTLRILTCLWFWLWTFLFTWNLLFWLLHYFIVNVLPLRWFKLLWTLVIFSSPSSPSSSSASSEPSSSSLKLLLSLAAF